MVATRSRSRGVSLDPLDSPLAFLDWHGDWAAEDIPDVIEFYLSDRFLVRAPPQDVGLYPRQATLLKLIFLQDEMLTQFDHDVIGEWVEGFHEPDPDLAAKAAMDDAIYRYEGTNGIQPDILERLRINKEAGRKWFREIIAAIGRRGSKGLIGAIAGSYVLWHYLSKADPQRHYGIGRNKQIEMFVFAAKKEQARDNQWRDLVDLITDSNCFLPYIADELGESLTLYARNDRSRMEHRAARGQNPLAVVPTFKITPRESTATSGRGPASMAQFYDEQAHVVKGVARADADAVYAQATPSLDQFGLDAFIFAGSSTWQMIGQFYKSWEQSLEIDPGTRAPIYPEKMMVQLTSWDPYEDWDRATQYERTPLGWANRRTFHLDSGGQPKTFDPIDHPVQAYNDQMRLLERSNPETFAVERRSRWAASLNAYLNPEKVEAIFGWWGDRRIIQQERGVLGQSYVAHGDPSVSGANFGFGVGHKEGPDERGLPHVVFDVVHAWQPSDFGGEQDYVSIEEDLEGYLNAFMPDQLTFDQFSSVGTIQRLQRYVLRANLPKRVQIWERTATKDLNWRTWETFKTAVNLGLVHAPAFQLAQLELTFLQDLGNHSVDHPTSGPVQTKDVADVMAIITYELISEQMAPYLREMLGELPLGGTLPGGTNVPQEHLELSSLGRGRGAPLNRPPRRGRY